MDFSKFEALDSRVSAILDKVADLTRQNGELTAALEAAQGRIAELEGEREAVLGRVDAILGRLG